MSFKKVSMGMAIALALSAGSAVAAVPGDTGTITFHGMVSNTTCKVSLDQKIDQSGNDFDVTLDTVSVADFGTTALGTTSTLGQKKFNLALTGCDTATEGGLLVPPANAQGSAKNVNLVLSNDGNTKTDLVKIDQTNNTQQATVDTSGAAKLYYKVAYTQGQGWDQTTNPVSAGTVQAQVAFTMNYE